MGGNSNQLYSRSEVANVAWNDDIDSVVLQWTDFASGEQFREQMDRCLELLEAVGGNKMFADAREQGAISDEDQQWSIADWAPRAEEAGLEYLVILYPEKVVAQMSVDNVIEEVEQIDDDIERHITDDLTEGARWLDERPSTATDVSVPAPPDEEPDLSGAETYARSDVATVSWSYDLDAVVLQWTDFASGEQFREQMDRCLELLEAVGGNKMFADARNQGAISDEDQQWSIADWAPRAEAAGLEHLVILYPEKVVAQMSVDNVIEEVEQIDDDIERHITDDLTEGAHWLDERPSTATDVSVPTYSPAPADLEITDENTYSDTGTATVGWMEGIDAVVLQWKGFARGEDFRTEMDRSLELLDSVGANKMFADAREQGAIADEDQQWSIVDWAARAQDVGLEYLVILYPEKVVAQMSVDNVIEEVEQIDDDIERHIVDSIADGWAWLGERPSTATDVTVPTAEPGTASEPADRAPPTGGTAADSSGGETAETGPAGPTGTEETAGPEPSPAEPDASEGTVSPETDVPKADGASDPAFVDATDPVGGDERATGERSTTEPVDSDAQFAAFTGAAVAMIATTVVGFLRVPFFSFGDNLGLTLGVVLVMGVVGGVVGWGILNLRSTGE